MTRIILALLALSGCRQPVTWNGDPPWTVVPISVQWATIDPVFDRSLRVAMASWNRAAGCTVFEQAGDWATSRVSISAYDGTICGDNRTSDLDTVKGAVAGAARCSADYAEVKLKVMSDIRSVHVSAMHELGHILGLTHDRSVVMREAAVGYDPASGQTLDVLPWPSDADGAAVGARYCR